MVGRPVCPSENCRIKSANTGGLEWLPCATHPKRCGAYVGIIAGELGLTTEQGKELAQCAPLHDIGKLVIPMDLLRAPRPLIPDEREIINTHTTAGAAILRRAQQASSGPMVPIWVMAIEMAEQHHERWDGTGYPKGAKGEEIPICARILAVADTYDAIRSARSYKPAKPHVEAVSIIAKEAGRHFDPSIVEVFLRKAEKFDEIRNA